MISEEIKKFTIFFRKNYRNLNWIEINGENIKYNINQIKNAYPDCNIAPVLKSNAYGHGLNITAKILDNGNYPFFIVDSLYEAYELYKISIKTPILIIGYSFKDNLKVKHLPFCYAIYDLDTAKCLNKYQPGCRVHIFIDTGMSREGIRIEEFEPFINKLIKLKNLKIKGLMSHLSSPYDQAITQKQTKKYYRALQILKKYAITPQWRHIGSSGSIPGFIDPAFNLVRPGISIYGIDLFKSNLNLKPALDFFSSIVQIKNISKGDTIGYDCGYTAKKDMTIAIIPAGYYEGLDRRFSNRGVVKINSDYCPVVGKISMNLTVIDISKIRNCFVGRKCCIFSSNPNDNNSIIRAAKKARMIPYNLLVGLNESINRRII